VRPSADKQLESSIAYMLLTGVIVSALLVFLGGVLYLHNGSRAVPDYRHFRLASPALRSVAGIVHGAMALEPDSVIQLGLVILIATPVVRVVFCVVGFLRQRDRLYLVISTAVFCILVYSLLQGGR